ncbi:fatty acid desaturase family protein [Frigoriflavimonas asaccharolytica]|uniref:Fatty acid desaturase n=1 Tax=Frigoriflavimonas asaccharolytica TaxID=2735899 RepID=A0A8J8K8Y4_9FLAO|nr:fatty acid desaturase [Frigoriflavimonas asaccharolytica]NRS92462.1 fatty acid desaturase [Frigoriflavimonas asaccharolytica]
MNIHKNSKLILETVFIFIANSFLACSIIQYIQNPFLMYALYLPLLIFQGFWYYRIYIVGHESAHKKLFSNNLKLNDIVGTLMLIPLFVPITIYRKIHYFHHGFNRKDEHTSALDTFIVKGKFKKLKTIYYYIIWYLNVFFGGFFLHSLVSVFLFLFMPPKLALKISPAFKGWTFKDQLKSIALFSLSVAFHFSAYLLLGKEVYLLSFGYPLLSFAWILSLLVYIFHYDTTIGNEVRYNVRSVKSVPFLSWILMNFNDHATHHQYPNIPWHELPKKRKILPQYYLEKNQTTWSFFRAIINQLKGPHIYYEN